MWKNAGREEALVDQDYKDAATLVAIVAPYRHARLSAVKLAGDPNATKEPGDDASLEELKRIVEFHLVRIAPVLDLQVIPIKGTDTEPRDGIANCDAPQGRAGNDAGASQGQRRVSDHRGGIGYRHDLPLCSQASRPIVMAQTSPPIANIVLSGRGGCQCTCLRPINVGQES